MGIMSRRYTGLLSPPIVCIFDLLSIIRLAHTLQATAWGMCHLSGRHSGPRMRDMGNGVQAVKKLLAKEFPELKRVETSSLHRGVAGARHSFLPAPPNSNKLDVLAQVPQRPFCESLAGRHMGPPTGDVCLLMNLEGYV